MEQHQWEHVKREWEQEKQNALNAFLGSNDQFIALTNPPEVLFLLLKLLPLNTFIIVTNLLIFLVYRYARQSKLKYDWRIFSWKPFDGRNELC